MGDELHNRLILSLREPPGMRTKGGRGEQIGDATLPSAQDPHQDSRDFSTRLSKSNMTWLWRVNQE
jgi:hypothetical protein